MERLDLAKRQFTHADVLKILPQLSSKTLINWKTRGIIDTPKDGPGKGHRHLYAGHGVVMLSFMEGAVRNLRIDPSDAARLAQTVAMCAQQLWDLELDEPAKSGMREIPPLFAASNQEYRRGFIYNYLGYGLRMELGRKDRTGSITPRYYQVVAVDLINLNVLNLINRHIAGLSPTEGHVYSRFDEDDEFLEKKNEAVLSKIKTLPVDELDSDA